MPISSHASAPPSDRSKGERTRRLVIDTAIELFFKKGIHQTTMAGIAKKAGLHATGIYVYFKNIEDLLAACAETAVEESRASISKGDPIKDGARKRLLHYFTQQFVFVKDTPDRALTLLGMYYYGTTYKPLRELHAWVDSRSQEWIEALLLQGNRESAWQIKQPGPMARVLHNELVGEMIKAMREPLEATPDARAKRVMALIA